MTTRLPFEILTAIFEKVDDVQDVRNIRATSRTFCAAAAPIAFRILSATCTTASAQNLGRLIDVPEIAAYVKEVIYRDAGAFWTPTRARTSATYVLASSFSRMHQLPQLETIDFTFLPVDGRGLDFAGGSRFALQRSILDALVASFSSRAPPKLISLSLHNLRISDVSPFECPPFQIVLKNLRRLRLSVLYDNAPDPSAALDRWWYFWGSLCYRLILAPTQHRLTELFLHTDIPVGASSRLSFAGLYFPNLRALSLRKLVFEPSVGVEPFVLRHASTLMRLELITCKLLMYHPIGDERRTHWEDIWDSFAKGLTALVGLHVNESNDYSYHRYVHYESRSYHMAFAPAHIDVADAAALERLYVIVDARSDEVRGAS